jgi:hypothetical protein
VAFADGTWPSNRWAVLRPEVSAQITEFVITRSACVFAASIVRREKREFTYIFFFFTFATDLDRHLLYYIIRRKHGFFYFLFIENMGSYFFCFFVYRNIAFCCFFIEKGGGGGMDCVVVEIINRRYNR